MSNFIFDQLDFARNITVFTVKDLTLEQVQKIPADFNNNILWNLGHIYMAQESFAFKMTGEPVVAPEGFAEWFAKGSKPADWTTQPDFPQILQLLQEQPARIRAALSDRLEDRVANPLTLPGLNVETVGQLLTLSLYHEGVHIQTIRMLHKLNG